MALFLIVSLAFIISFSDILELSDDEYNDSFLVVSEDFYFYTLSCFQIFSICCHCMNRIS